MTENKRFKNFVWLWERSKSFRHQKLLLLLFHVSRCFHVKITITSTLTRINLESTRNSIFFLLFICRVLTESSWWSRRKRAKRWRLMILQVSTKRKKSSRSWESSKRIIRKRKKTGRLFTSACNDCWRKISARISCWAKLYKNCTKRFVDCSQLWKCLK